MLALALVLAACAPRYSWQADLRHHIALQRGCPEDDIAIVADNGDELARQVRVDMCGESRMYEHVNAGATYEWRDITGTAEDAAPYVLPN